MVVTACALEWYTPSLLVRRPIGTLYRQETQFNTAVVMYTVTRRMWPLFRFGWPVGRRLRDLRESWFFVSLCVANAGVHLDNVRANMDVGGSRHR